MIQIDSICLSYNQQKILNKFSLSVEQGAKIAVSGRSGSGKSSVLRCLLGFAVPDQGRIFVNGTELNGSTVWKIRSLIGYVAQEPDLGEGTVKKIIEKPFAYKANQSVTENLKQLG